MDDAYLSYIVDDLGNQIQRRFEVTQSYDGNKTAQLRSCSNVKNVRNDSWYGCRRPSLQSRLQDGKNLQLCFVNQESSEIEDNQLDDGLFSLPIFQSKCVLDSADVTSLPVQNQPVPANIKNLSSDVKSNRALKENDTNNNTRKHYEFRNEICMSLKKIYANTNREMELEHHRRCDSPITCTIKTSLKKVGVDDGSYSRGHRRMSRQMLTKMNSYQLQTIIDDLHVHVEYLNEQLMKMLMERDELHMRRDSLLVDIEDITAYLDAKQGFNESNFKNCASHTNYPKNNAHNSMMPSTCTKNNMLGLRFNRLTSYIRN